MHRPTWSSDLSSVHALSQYRPELRLGWNDTDEGCTHVGEVGNPPYAKSVSIQTFTDRTSEEVKKGIAKYYGIEDS